jgi:Zn-dependent M28 family amino/carboxypeptidase
MLLGLGCGGGGERPETALPEVSPARLEEHIRHLASDRLGGRGTGSPGYDSAARYVADHFAALGLEPAGTKGYFQPVPFRRARSVEGSGIVLLGKSGRRALTPYRHYIPLANFFSPRVEVTAPLVFAGFGVSAPERSHDDYRELDVKGKLVVLLTGAPASFPPAERAHYSDSRVKRENAVGRGAVGILIVRTRDQTFPWARLVSAYRAGDMRWLDSAGAPTGVSPAIRGAAILSDSTAALVFRDAPQPLGEVLAAAERGTPPRFDLRSRATIRTISAHQRLESPNVAALLRGSDARLRDEVVIYSAHLDHLGIGVPVEGDSIYNGALDNASGTAAMLEVARSFTTLPRPPRRSLLFLAVTGEEEGLLGSDYFAEYPTVPLQRIVANINLDGLGILYPMREMVAFGAEHSTLEGPVARVAERMGIAIAPDPFPQEVFFVRSDQYSFVRRGVPAVFPFMGLRSDSGVDAGARFKEWFAVRYHTPKDDLDQPMDLESGARNAQFEFLLGLEVADADERPAWKPGDFFERTFGRKPPVTGAAASGTR